ncbi:RNA-binding protein hfq [Synechococcus sp. Nb3U1]|uniref:Hfq-related RNA-binding protein n=1 Tax=Synechococcus sp. Nb3U1 TaxID=1914529 RepID=UPI001F459180|nr:RNA-binding protein hfq [Synechococcus sp. Nb3U1]MCF2970631.1 RNA-binding protein hfq [Synechococcus sp. Nb3U1]
MFLRLFNRDLLPACGATVADLNAGIPSVRRLQKGIKDREIFEIKLSTGDTFVGQLRWQDPDCLCLTDAGGQESLLWRSAIAFIKVKSHP